MMSRCEYKQALKEKRHQDFLKAVNSNTIPEEEKTFAVLLQEEMNKIENIDGETTYSITFIDGKPKVLLIDKDD